MRTLVSNRARRLPLVWLCLSVSGAALAVGCSSGAGNTGGAGGTGGATASSTHATTSSGSTSGSTTGSSTSTGFQTGSSSATTSSGSTTSGSTTSSTASGTGGAGGQGGSGGMGQGGGGGAGGAPPVTELDCADHVDNDNDNQTDCADSDCAGTAVCGTVLINEIDYDEPGADMGEFVEIFNAGSQAVTFDGVSLELVNGGSVPPASYGSIDLTGQTLPAGHYLVVGDASVVVPAPSLKVTLGVTIQNGPPDGVALYDSHSHTLIDSLPYEGAVDGAVIDGHTFNLGHGTATTAADRDPAPNISVIRLPNGAHSGNDAIDWTTTTLVTPGAKNLIPENCSNNLDDDGDTLVDCADPDCAAAPGCFEICNDNVDNNANSLIDCQEMSCDTKSCAPNGKVCASGACTCPGGNVEMACGDMLDDDCDGLVDCSDPDCFASLLCSENCSDGMDNNANMLVDCADPVCTNQSCGANGLVCSAMTQTCACPSGTTESSCTDATDNNCNGLVDCADTDCAMAAVCSNNIWVNEIHYDNAGADSGEGVEIAGPAGKSLAGYFVYLYDGGSGNTYPTTVALTGTIPSQNNGFGTLWFPITGLQNGSPDGVALVGPGSTVIQFLSYEGSFAANNGPAMGSTSIDIGVSEGTSSPVGQSLQLTGTGTSYAQFTWAAAATATPGAVNNGQTF